MSQIYKFPVGRERVFFGSFLTLFVDQREAGCDKHHSCERLSNDRQGRSARRKRRGLSQRREAQSSKDQASSRHRDSHSSAKHLQRQRNLRRSLSGSHPARWEFRHQSQSSGLTRQQTVSTSFERATKLPLGQRTICAFTTNSVRQVGFGIGDKLVNGVGDVICQHWIPTSILSRSHHCQTPLAMAIGWIGCANCPIETFVHYAYVLCIVNSSVKTRRFKICQTG